MFKITSKTFFLCMHIIFISANTKNCPFSICFNVLGLMLDPNFDATRNVKLSILFFVGWILHYTLKLYVYFYCFLFYG